MRSAAWKLGAQYSRPSAARPAPFGLERQVPAEDCQPGMVPGVRIGIASHRLLEQRGAPEVGKRQLERELLVQMPRGPDVDLVAQLVLRAARRNVHPVDGAGHADDGQD